MAEKSQLELGQRVKFLRSHDRNVELTGKIVKLHEGSDAVDIETEADGKIAEVSTTETAHASDVTVLAEVAAEEETASDTGARSRDPRRRRFAGD